MEWCAETFQPGLMLDRRDNDGNYSPDNCRWVTLSDSQKNRRYDTPAFKAVHKKAGRARAEKNKLIYGDPLMRNGKVCPGCNTFRVNDLYTKSSAPRNPSGLAIRCKICDKTRREKKK